METTMHKLCTLCKKSKNIMNFTKGNKILKRCSDCRDKIKNNRIKSLCPHSKDKSYCKSCKGSQICQHNRIRNSCKDCEGGRYCIHTKIKIYCKICDGSGYCEHDKHRNKCKLCSKDPLNLLLIRIIQGSKSNDKKNNIYDKVNFIDKCYLKNIIDKSNYQCCYCNCKLQILYSESNLMSIERIDNKLGHIKGNVKISCIKCNISKIGNHGSLEKMKEFQIERKKIKYSKKKVKINCICGSLVSKGYLSEHIKTQTHKKNLELLNM